MNSTLDSHLNDVGLLIQKKKKKKSDVGLLVHLTPVTVRTRTKGLVLTSEAI